MIKTYTSALLFLFFTVAAQAQFTDDFSDGDFTANPAWSGDNAQFIVNASGQLQLNSTGTAVSYLSAQNAQATLNNTEWRFFIRQNFSPSSSNYGRVYLVADQSNVTNPLNGYYLQFGEALSNDAVELFRSDGTTSTSVCRGINAQIANSFSIGVKVTRDNSGLWTLAIDAAGGNNYAVEATGTDVTYNTSAYIGVMCAYTSSNATNFYFDNFYVGTIVVDTTPPQISSVTVVNSNSLDVFFNEPVEQTSAEIISNYSVNNIGQPQSALRDANNLALVHLSFANNFPTSVTDTLTINNVKDIALNTIASNSFATFIYTVPVTPSAFDLVINEIMADPDPAVGLPADAEFVEVFNRSNKTFDLTGWSFSDASSSVTFGSKTIAPGDYLILCSTANQSAFSSFGNVYGFSSFPSLNNTGGEMLTLRDNTSLIIDNVYYDETFYQDATKAGGGWSIERVDPDFTCTNKLNWKASVDAAGGTPGRINSVDAIFADNIAPYVSHACALDSNHVQIFFSKAIAVSALSNINNYTFKINSTIFLPVGSAPATDYLSIILTTPFNLITLNLPVEIIVNPTVSDCPGNAIGNNSTIVQWAQAASVSDIVINEVLFSAKAGGAEFVELYNRSNKAFDLKDLRITRIDLTTGITDPSSVITTDCYLLLPRHYIVLTDNPDAVKSQYHTDPNAFVQMNLPDLLTDEDIIVLEDATSHTIDQLHYYSFWHYPLLNDLHGVSLERINPDRITQDQNNWHSASETAGFATPGLRNSQFSDATGDGSTVTIEPEIFSPDNDGTNDVTNITYHFDQPGFTGNVDVFDDRGRLMTHLVKNELLGTDGSWSWNGINDKNEKARIGVYIIYMEAFDLKGAVKKYKKTCVLAGKL